MFIEQIPKPLLEDFVNNRVIPFVGSGFSKNAKIPSGVNMPDWPELGKLAADNIPDYTYDGNPIDALSYYEECYSRTKLVEFLINNTGSRNRDVYPGDVYKSFFSLFSNTICTTNFDALIEDTMTALKKPFSVIVSEERLAVQSDGEIRILKVHGDFDHPNKMVVTERDYDRYIDENPIMSTHIANLFLTNTMLLVGYSLDDRDLRSILQVINDRLGKMTLPVYCITLNATQDKIDRFRRRNVKVINFTDKKETYSSLFTKLSMEIKDYIDNQRKSSLKSNDDKINTQLAIPRSYNSLCYLACSLSRMPQVAALVNPLLEHIDITSVNYTNFVTPNDNWMSKIETIFEKMNAAIIDVSEYSQIVELEIQIATKSLGDNEVIFICEENSPCAYDIDYSRVIYYSLGTSMASEDFSEKIIARLSSIKDSAGDNVPASKRLFDKEEYSSSVAMAYSELEKAAEQWFEEQRRLDAAICKEVRNTYPLGRFLLRTGFIDESEWKDFIKLQDARNSVVHETAEITKKEAKTYNKFAYAISDKIKKAK